MSFAGTGILTNDHTTCVFLTEHCHPYKGFAPDQLGSIRRKQIARWLYLSLLKNDSFCLSKKIWLVKYASGYHPGPEAPPRTDGAPFIT